MKILVANLGSTSFKYHLFDMADERVLARGGVERIGSDRSRCYVQAGAVRPTLRAVGLEEVLPAALASLGARAADVEARLTETLPPVLADAPLLERVLANVIDNALRHSPPGGIVRVDAGCVREGDGDRIEIRVADRGPGIPRDQRDHVFEPFQRLGDSNAGGVGLGLAVARGFLGAMGATIEIEDTPGGGTTMLVSAPVAP